MVILVRKRRSTGREDIAHEVVHREQAAPAVAEVLVLPAVHLLREGLPVFFREYSRTSFLKGTTFKKMRLCTKIAIFYWFPWAGVDEGGRNRRAGFWRTCCALSGEERFQLGVIGMVTSGSRKLWLYHGAGTAG